MAKELKEVKARLAHSEIEREKFQYAACSPKVIDHARSIGFEGPVGGDMIRVVIEDLLDNRPADTSSEWVSAEKGALTDLALILINLEEATQHIRDLKSRIVHADPSES